MGCVLDNQQTPHGSKLFTLETNKMSTSAKSLTVYNQKLDYNIRLCLSQVQVEEKKNCSSRWSKLEGKMRILKNRVLFGL